MDDRLLALRARLKTASASNTKAAEEEHRRETRISQPAAKPDAALREAGRPAAKPLVAVEKVPEDRLPIEINKALPTASADTSATSKRGSSGKRPGADRDEAAPEGKRARRGSEGADDADSAPPPMAPAYAFEDAITAQKKLAASIRKEENRALAFGMSSVVNEDAQARSYQRELKRSVGKLATGASAGGADAAGDDYADDDGVMRMAAHVSGAGSKKDRDSSKKDAGGHISVGNARFNAQLAKSLDKYTVELKQAIERGSAT